MSPAPQAHGCTVCAYSVAEWTRAAVALEARGEWAKAATLRMGASMPFLSAKTFDAVSDIYRAWLVFGERAS